MDINVDSFSSGQVGSKIWLCEELERTGWTSKLTWIYGGWYGLTAFLLLSRGKFTVDKIRSYDIDPSCQPVADMINENWVWQDWKFKAETADCLQIKPFFGPADLIINTSTEHFESLEWFENITKGTRVLLQGNNMPHDDHIVNFNNLNEYQNYFNLSEYLYVGQKEFVYPTWRFDRYMLIGVK